MADTATRKVGRYEVERELAEGGMGVVYLARQPSLERPVVLKRKRRELADDEEAEARFQREALTIAGIHHPNVVAVFDCFTWRGEPYIVCEYVDGLDAATALTRVERFPHRIAALVALEIARGLEELHGRSLVHRDVKPDNVLLGRHGEVKIGDFGIAHDAKQPALTRTGISLGTPAYMSPEQLRGERVDHRSDLFSLGAVLYELIAGRTPFPQPDPEDEQAEPSLLLRIERGVQVSLRRAARGTPRVLCKIVERCLRAKAERRYASTSELRRALELYLGEPAPADARREIAEWLADRRVFPAKGKTKRAARRVEGEASPRVRRGLRWALAAAVAGLLLSIALLEPGRPQLPPDWTVLTERWLSSER